MGTFQDPLDLRYVDGRDWVLLRSFTYWHIDNVVYFVPAGFTTDFASIPRFFWRFLPPTGRYGKAAVIHDCLYRTPSIPVTREQADNIFRDAMKDLGVGWWTRNTMFRAVRLFGRRAYKPRT